MKLGRNVARTFLDYYKLVGYISAKPSSSINLKSPAHGEKDKVSSHVQLDLEEGRYAIPLVLGRFILIVLMWNRRVT